jgi:hypothetical protein
VRKFRKREIETDAEAVEKIEVGIGVFSSFEIAHEFNRHLATLCQLFLRQTLLVPQNDRKSGISGNGACAPLLPVNFGNRVDALCHLCLRKTTFYAQSTQGCAYGLVELLTADPHIPSVSSSANCRSA